MREQWMSSLERANEVRLWLAEQRAAVAEGDVDRWCELCASGDPRLKSVTLYEFLQWPPKVGAAKARKIISENFVWPTAATYGRRVDRLDLRTALRLNSAVRAIYERLSQAA